MQHQPQAVPADAGVVERGVEVTRRGCRGVEGYTIVLDLEHHMVSLLVQPQPHAGGRLMRFSESIPGDSGARCVEAPAQLVPGACGAAMLLAFMVEPFEGPGHRAGIDREFEFGRTHLPASMIEM